MLDKIKKRLRLGKIKKRLRNENCDPSFNSKDCDLSCENVDYDLSFQEFIKKLNIEEDFKKYEDAYVASVTSTFDRYVKALEVPDVKEDLKKYEEDYEEDSIPRSFEWCESPETSSAKEAFRDKKLVEEAKSNLRKYITSVVNSSTLWGYNKAYNLVPGTSLPIAKMIASCIDGMAVLHEIRNESETGRAVSVTLDLDAFPTETDVCKYIRYLQTLNSKMVIWFKHYLERNPLRCLDDIIYEDSEDWDCFINNVSRTLTHIAIYKTAKKSDYFVMSMHSIFEIASLRFILQELKEELGIRIFYDGNDNFPLEMYTNIFDNIKFGSTYSECYNKSALNDIWKNAQDYYTIMNALYDEFYYLWLETYADVDARVDKIYRIADAVYDKDRYLIVNKGTESEKNIDQIIKSNPEYSAFYSVEL